MDFTFILIGLCLYFLPTLIAGSRKHKNDGAIFILNLFLGWTFLGWLIALIWAATDNVRKPSTSSNSMKAKSQSKAEELERLASLTEKGVLTDEEFQQQKAAILSS